MTSRWWFPPRPDRKRPLSPLSRAGNAHRGAAVAEPAQPRGAHRLPPQRSRQDLQRRRRELIGGSARGVARGREDPGTCRRMAAVQASRGRPLLPASGAWTSPRRVARAAVSVNLQGRREGVSITSCRWRELSSSRGEKTLARKCLRCCSPSHRGQPHQGPVDPSSLPTSTRSLPRPARAYGFASVANSVYFWQVGLAGARRREAAMLAGCPRRLPAEPFVNAKRAGAPALRPAPDERSRLALARRPQGASRSRCGSIPASGSLASAPTTGGDGARCDLRAIRRTAYVKALDPRYYRPSGARTRKPRAALRLGVRDGMTAATATGDRGPGEPVAQGAAALDVAIEEAPPTRETLGDPGPRRSATGSAGEPARREGVMRRARRSPCSPAEGPQAAARATGETAIPTRRRGSIVRLAQGEKGAPEHLAAWAGSRRRWSP